MLGMGPRYFSESLRPSVYNYFNRMKQRPSVVKTFSVAKQVAMIHIKMAAKQLGVVAVKVGLLAVLIGAGYVGYKKLSSSGILGSRAGSDL